MKRVLSRLGALLLCLCLLPAVPAAAATTTLRAVWVATIYNGDFPKTKNNAAAQKQEFSALLDKLQAMGMNAVVVQVRPKSDALYPSALNPWSEVLTGTQGQDPGYDPLAYMIQEAHARGMAFHAWLNPYRVTTSGTDVNALAANNPARLHPDWLLTYQNALYYDPANEAVKDYLCETVAEIVKNYDVDGIHFDDYFYPSGYPLSGNEGREGAEANARRETVNDLIRRVYQTIQAIDPAVEFGVSPVGIWKNQKSDPSGSATTGYEGYYSLYADPLAWARGGYVDYLAPQLYWETGLAAADYETLVQWWQNALRGTGVTLYIGQGLYKDAIAAQINTQLDINEKYGVTGSFFFSARDLTADRQGAATALTARFGAATQPTTPVPAQPTTPPATESPAAGDSGNGVLILSTTPETARPSAAAVRVDGQAVTMEAYNLEGYTYFKLRDVAAALRQTPKAFAVGYDDAARQISVTTGTPYVLTGGELSGSAASNQNALPCLLTIRIDGAEVKLTAYNIGGNNYIKLRELGSALNFGVSWNAAGQTIDLSSATGYSE